MDGTESQLEQRFQEGMVGIYEAVRRLKPACYAIRFLHPVSDHGGRNAADRLLATDQPSEVFTELFLRGKGNLEVSVEYLVLTEAWRSLFKPRQLAAARKRLQDHECELPPDDGS